MENKFNNEKQEMKDRVSQLDSNINEKLGASGNPTNQIGGKLDAKSQENPILAPRTFADEAEKFMDGHGNLQQMAENTL